MRVPSDLAIFCRSILALAMLASPLVAQISPAIVEHSGSANVRSGLRMGVGSTVHTRPAFSHPLANPAVFLGTPWFGDYEFIGAQPQPTPLIVVETQPSAPPVQQETKPVSPLLIEWRGDRFVRYSGTEGDRAVGAQADYAGGHAPASERRAASTDLAPAVLVFRDGHREQIRAFVISAGVIYAQGNYWSDGYWSRQIQLSALNVAETLQANPNGEFRLPSAQNEVVTRP